jgi:NitT/TauT family transport system ATP-binding protein
VTALVLDRVGMVYQGSGRSVAALEEISTGIGRGEFVSIVGPSGCGKSTLLKLVFGIRRMTSGAISIAGERVAGPRRDVGMVFQSPVLLPWRRILDNVMLPVEVLGLPRTDYEHKARKLLELVGLGGFEQMYPQELSGGMQQRAAIARALVFDAPVLLMDEPFGALDAMTREHMNLELQRIWQSDRRTILFVTHSIAEAAFLSDRILVMSPRPGRILEDIRVEAPRPRALDDMQRPAFGEIVSRVRRLLGGSAGGHE